jgi:hypothetical protein
LHEQQLVKQEQHAEMLAQKSSGELRQPPSFKKQGVNIPKLQMNMSSTKKDRIRLTIAIAPVVSSYWW